LFVSFFYLANWWMRLLRRGRSIARKRRLKLEKRLRKRLAPHKGLVLRYGLGRRLARAVRGPGRRS
jgi:hypothetical protein